MKDRPVESEIIRKDSLNILWSVFNGLPIKQKLSVGGVYLEGKKLPEIADELNISKERVRGNKVRAIRLIRNKMMTNGVKESDF